jgi:hypothetical protein
VIKIAKFRFATDVIANQEYIFGHMRKASGKNQNIVMDAASKCTCGHGFGSFANK